MPLRGHLALERGHLEILARDQAALDAAAEWARQRAQAGGRFAGPHELAMEAAWCKAEPLRGRAPLRHGLRRSLLRRPAPRLVEFENLEWLRARSFEAPAPLAAGVWWRAGLPRWQFLFTREVRDTQTLRTLLERGADDPAQLLDELAREVARLHALRFVHRDLFPRNLLVRDASASRRLVFLDAWRGGARPQLRGAAYDLACMFLHLPRWLSHGEQRAWFDHYLEQRAVQGRGLEALPFARAVVRERRALVRRYERRGRAHELEASGDWSL